MVLLNDSEDVQSEPASSSVSDMPDSSTGAMSAQEQKGVADNGQDPPPLTSP